MVSIKAKDKPLIATRTVDLICEAGVRCEIAAPGGHTVVIDEPEIRGGTGSGASPLAHLTAALASCQTMQTVKVAEAMRFTHGAIRTKCSTTTERMPSTKGNDRVMRFTEAQIEIEVETNEAPERIERLKILSEDRCPVSNLFADAGAKPIITWTVRPMTV